MGASPAAAAKASADFESSDAACLGDELSGEQGPHTGQAAYEGRIRVADKAQFDVAIELREDAH